MSRIEWREQVPIIEILNIKLMTPYKPRDDIELLYPIPQKSIGTPIKHYECIVTRTQALYGIIMMHKGYGVLPHPIRVIIDYNFRIRLTGTYKVLMVSLQKGLG